MDAAHSRSQIALQTFVSTNVSLPVRAHHAHRTLHSRAWLTTRFHTSQSRHWFAAIAALLCCLPLTGCTNARAAFWKRSEACEKLVEQAREAHDRGDTRTATQLYSQAVTKNPQNGETHLELAENLIEQGQHAAATQQLKQLQRDQPNDPRAHLKLAEVLYLQGEFRDSETAVNEALRLDGTLADALVLAGRLAEQRRRDDVALELYYRALLQQPPPVAAQLQIAAIHLRHRRARQAVPVILAATENRNSSDDQRTSATWQLGEAYAQLERWPESLEALESVAGDQRRPLTIENWNQLAYCRMRCGDRLGAISATQSALDLKPDDANAVAMRAYLQNTNNLPENSPSRSSPRFSEPVLQYAGRTDNGASPDLNAVRPAAGMTP